MAGRTYEKSYKVGSYNVAMYKEQGGYNKTHKVLTLSVPCSEGEGTYPVTIRNRRFENAEAETKYQKAVKWINTMGGGIK